MSKHFSASKYKLIPLMDDDNFQVDIDILIEYEMFNRILLQRSAS